MILTVDIGNTNTTFGFFAAERGNLILEKFFRMSTLQKVTTDELSASFFQLIDLYDLRKSKVDRCFIASVVPHLNHSFSKMISHYTTHPVTHIRSEFVQNIEICYERKEDLGIDRLLNLKAAKQLYSSPVIVVDYGTAITVDVLDGNSRFIGGLIIPGLQISLDALVSKTSGLPRVELQKPQRLLGMSTKECMQNGIHHINTLGIDAIVQQIQRQFFPKQKVFVVGTGGLSRYFGTIENRGMKIEPHLTLMGIKIVADEYIQMLEKSVLGKAPVSF